MDLLFCPWRYAYVTAARPAKQQCVLCAIGSADPREDERDLVVGRSGRHFVVLNRYPYNNGHLLIVPYRHVARLSELSEDELHELFRLTARAEAVMEEVYHPGGLNVGMNLGSCAGAGIAEHLHVHVVPRWSGDTSFMTVAGETRILPEDLGETWRKLHGRF
jgi:ATP adenylyltransferase